MAVKKYREVPKRPSGYPWFSLSPFGDVNTQLLCVKRKGGAYSTEGLGQSSSLCAASPVICYQRNLAYKLKIK